MTRCYISEQIADYCNQPDEEYFVCWNCGEDVEEDVLIEVETKRDGTQFIAPCCIDDYITEGV